MTDRGGRIGVVVPAAGRGRRMGKSLSKQFLELDGKSIVQRTLEQLQLCDLIDDVVVVVSPDAIDEVRELVRAAELSKVIDVVCGGEERQDSVWNGLEALKERNVEVVLVHDGVRPFINGELVRRVVGAAVRHRAAVPAVQATDTVKLSISGAFVERTLPREGLWLAQTPQGFDYRLLYEAFQRARAEKFIGTDDASLVERLGEKVSIVEGSPDNIKITTPRDLETAKSILARTLSGTTSSF